MLCHVVKKTIALLFVMSKKQMLCHCHARHFLTMSPPLHRILYSKQYEPTTITSHFGNSELLRHVCHLFIPLRN